MIHWHNRNYTLNNVVKKSTAETFISSNPHLKKRDSHLIDDQTYMMMTDTFGMAYIFGFDETPAPEVFRDLGNAPPTIDKLLTDIATTTSTYDSTGLNVHKGKTSLSFL